MAGIDVNTSTLTLPSEVSTVIMQKLQEDSAVMTLAQSMELPGLGVTIPVITGDPEASWVSETNEKPVARPGLSTKIMQPYTLAVIVPFSNQFRNNVPSLYEAIVSRLPMALAQKFDATVFGAVAAPGTNFDTLDSATAQAFTNPWEALVAADQAVAEAGGITNGYVISPQAKAKLLTAMDGNNRPLFVNSVSEGGVPMLLGSPTIQRKAAYVESGVTSTEKAIAFAGDWTQAIYGVAQGLNVSISDQATLTDGGTTINLWQRNMFAVRAEIEVGFVADVKCFAKFTA